MDSAASSQQLDSGPEGSGISRVLQRKNFASQSKKRNQCKARDFQSTLGTDFLGEEGVTTHEKTNLLAEHLRIGLGHRKPHSVHSVIVFCDFKSVMLPSTEVSPLIPIPIIGYVLSQSSTVHSMTEWFPDATWAPVPCGLADHPDFLLYISLAENTAAPWFKLSVFG